VFICLHFSFDSSNSNKQRLHKATNKQTFLGGTILLVVDTVTKPNEKVTFFLNFKMDQSNQSIKFAELINFVTIANP